MKRLTHTLSFLFVLMLALFLFIGCAKPPEAEKSAAQTAANLAKAAGGEQYAAVEMEAGKMLWNVAETQLRAEKFTEAKVAYLAAKDVFVKAVNTAKAAKQSAIAEMNKTLTGLEEGWKTVEANALAIEKKMVPQKEAWDADALLFAQELAAAKAAVATDLNGAKAKVEVLKAMIEKWNATIQELASVPEKPQKKKRK
jgi:hypothetical protein